MRSSETPVFTAIDDSVSPDFTVYVRRFRARRFEDFERFDTVRVLPFFVVVAVDDEAAGSSDESRFELTIEYTANTHASRAIGASQRAGLRRRDIRSTGG